MYSEAVRTPVRFQRRAMNNATINPLIDIVSWMVFATSPCR